AWRRGLGVATTTIAAAATPAAIFLFVAITTTGARWRARAPVRGEATATHRRGADETDGSTQRGKVVALRQIHIIAVADARHAHIDAQQPTDAGLGDLLLPDPVAAGVFDRVARHAGLWPAGRQPQFGQ